MAFLMAVSILLPPPTATAAHAQTAAPGSAQAISSAVTQVVLNIISYTRWPAGTTDLRLCVVPGPSHADALLKVPAAVAGHRILPAPLALEADGDGADCDIVYFGMLSDAQQVRLRTAITSRPLLTISEDEPSCATGAMFCLDTQDGQVNFAVNLDSVARSGVQVSARVLLLGRGRTAP